ncbi:glycosyltransferase [Serratia marcescens]|uniref:glycosyltransferase n=1 Tax=Serratia marcescens TaxID=615 RepID=UPI0011544120|nr:glycosyltransferase [Serratia marcescens]QDI17967.1 glycosyltransferase [Serratia marcescens]QDI27710.1 glycosyltransferase [Serratia marcescens]QDI42173.1 glycosyltransferase [Serratia marcescens]QDI56602.1 glycosyltransferase [Serratia marcescens]
MLKGRKVAVIFTASILGGHEVMAVSHLSRYIKKDVRVTCYIPSGNSKLAELLIASSICYEFHDVRHNNMEIIHSFFNPRHIFRAAGFLISIKEKFDFIFIIQGDIEFGSVFVNVGKMLGIKKIISYLPYTHSFRKMESWAPSIKDFLAKFVYRNCNSFVTICETTAKDIIAKNKNASVRVLENFVAKPRCSEIRGIGYEFSPSNETLKVIMAGRVLFRQKGQDILFNALKYIDFPIELQVFGDGPDLKRLRELAANLSPNIKVVFLGWRNNVWENSRDIDFIVVPSRYEGVPLIMLESLARNIPVISPARDGMINYLTSESLYNTGSADFESRELSKKISDFFFKREGEK